MGNIGKTIQQVRTKSEETDRPEKQTVVGQAVKQREPELNASQMLPLKRLGKPLDERRYLK